MTRTRLPFRSALALGAVLTLLVTAGCAAADTAPDEGASAAPTTASTSSETDAATDEASCAGVGDVLTILHNVDAAAHEERMSDQERGLWHALATRVLERVPASGEGPVSEALVAFKAAIPVVAASGGGSASFESDSANAAGADLREACETAGYEIMTEGFVGG